MASESAHALTCISWSTDLRTLAGRFGSAIAITNGDGDGQLTYNELCTRAHALARQLIKQGAGPGKSIATLLPNSADAVWASYGVKLSGAAEVPMNWGYTDEEISWCAHLAGFQVVVTLNKRGDSLRAIGLEALAIETVAQEDPGTALAAVPADAFGRIMFTSGTTGKPKGAVYTHERRWVGEQLLKATLPFTPSPGSRLILMTPFSHGASLLTFAWCDHGGEIILHNGVDPIRIFEQLSTGTIDAIFAPPTVLAKLVQAAQGATFPGLKCIFTGTQPLPPLLYKKACALFGPIIRITYGKTECINPITVLDPPNTHLHFTQEASIAGTCLGWAAPGVELLIKPNAVPEFEKNSDGEVWLRARHMSIGMIHADGFKPHEPDGWHQTGDLGYIDAQGRLILTGRMADVIKTGGYRVNPDEIESCLAGLQACGQVCITSIPSDYWGEIIVAVAEAASNNWHEEASVRVTGLSRHKHPRAYLTIKALPRNPQGKVSRKQTSMMVLAAYKLIDGPYPEITAKTLTM